MTISNEELNWMYETMYKIRYYEDKMVEAYAEGKNPVFNIGAGTVPGEMHLATGQEPAAAGISIHLKKDDIVSSPHRPHHHAIAKGVNLNKMTAEIFGKETGLGKGKGGHMHLFDPEVHFSCGGIVGAGIPHAVGAALAAKKKNKDSVAVAFIGEGAANQGAFHESLNLAALWNLPFIIVVENNKYGISVPKSHSTSIPSNDLRASAYGVKGYYVKDNDPIAMYEVSGEAVERARNGEGPSIIEIETYRYLGHFQGDAEVYRDENEVTELREKDPIKLLREKLISDYNIEESEITAMESRAIKDVDHAYAFARESDYPKPEAALEDLFD
ncbi:thiamine pyrophosphate-dependent dehydrogenase E1 component subunit alpha [Oceanobacillus halophilus]|uniref:Thiamine pyrophosphate-dependent dehydrogenase E1 component subunit alpha n=1 Tax=Oceanobacillus halophilus TaxID=930130 RepID=A0A495A0E0_9BACI|nr:thiamine pyrophosphate-dependent dehydrogenase E1 component subunit alpha [Oceanobacillus halophilus]RKQ32693.1 thiamine pyrophosphate-dependent dehydrogenase E1 component subunit alpha [Oceanobacillus halophilus]